MTMQDYHCTITANLSPKEAFDRINRVGDWWTSDIEGSSRNLNDVFTVRFAETFVTFKISELIPGKKVVWQVTDGYLHWLNDKKEWNGTEIVFDISTVDNATQVDMTHVGLVPGIECYDNCEKGWNHFIKDSLFKLLTENKGVPDGNGRPRKR